jgi:hypothetical protein
VSIEVNGFALQGLDRAQQKLERAARRIAQSTTPPAGDSGDLNTSTVDVIEAVNLYKANANMVKAEDEMTKRVLNILA